MGRVGRGATRHKVLPLRLADELSSLRVWPHGRRGSHESDRRQSLLFNHAGDWWRTDFLRVGCPSPGNSTNSASAQYAPVGGTCGRNAATLFSGNMVITNPNEEDTC